MILIVCFFYAGQGPKPSEGTEGWEPKISFFPLRHKIRSFLPSLGGPFVESWWCLKRRGAQMCTFGVLWLSCEAPAAPKPPGLTPQPDVDTWHVVVLPRPTSTTIRGMDTLVPFALVLLCQLSLCIWFGVSARVGRIRGDCESSLGVGSDTLAPTL